VRCHAYQLPSEVYRELEAQLLEGLANATLEQLGYLLGEHDLKVELLSGEWRVLFDATRDLSYQVVNPKERRARMAVSPDELADFVSLLRNPARQAERAPELVPVVEATISPPAIYRSIRKSLSRVADPRTQPSLDAWLRVHAAGHQYALYFRDVRRELE
jgi:hypothetical protein